MTYPEKLRYTEEHEWVDLEDNIVKIGITSHAQEELGDVVFVELPESGQQVEQGDAVATIESVKAVSDVFAPLTGKVVSVNSELEDAPETINEDPYGKGWLFTIKVEDPSVVDELLDVKGYQTFLADE